MSVPQGIYRQRSVLILMLASFFAWAGVWLSPMGPALESTVAQRLEFMVREVLGRAPKIDPRIKIFAYGDLAVEAFGAPELLPLRDWTVILGSIAARKPKAILVDRLFNLPQLDSGDADFFRKLKDMNVPIYAAASVHEQPLMRREAVPDQFFQRYIGKIPFLALSGDARYAYGPSRAIVDVFAGVGHIVLVEDGFMDPLYVWDDGRFLPTLGLRVGSRFDLGRQGFLVEGRQIPVNGRGRIPVNFSERKLYLENLLSMKTVVESARRGVAQGQVEAGDVVVVLPQMFTGSVDFKRTPVGKMEGGLIHVAVANSLLSGRWISTWGDGAVMSLLLLFGLSVLGGSGAHMLSPRLGFFWVFSGVLFLVVFGLSTFVFQDLRLFWFHPLLAFTTSGFFVIANKAVFLELHSRRVNHALEGLVSPGLMKTLMKNPDALKLEPREIQATVMFVDVEGFSLRAEIRRPAQVFFELKEQLQRVAAIIHKHGGIIDKTLGDGLLAFFGYSYDEKMPSAQLQNHAIAAVACAVEIQRVCAKLAVNTQEKVAVPGAVEEVARPDAVLPLRIGLNSGPVFLGNLGSGLRIDFTIVGDTVNFAKRLEDASETFRVMIGSQTKHMLTVGPFAEGGAVEYRIPAGAALRRRLLSIKHHHELIEGWECDPFVNEPEVFRAALNSAREKISRNAQRWSVPEEVACVVSVNRSTEGRLRNFSLSGFGFESKEYLARRVQVTIEIDNPDGTLRKRLQASGLLPLVCEVRWGSVLDGVVSHGVQILNFDAAQRELLIKILLEDIAARYESASG